MVSVSHSFHFLEHDYVLRDVANVRNFSLFAARAGRFSNRMEATFLHGWQGNGMYFGVYDRFDTMGAMALGGTTLRFRI